jgi:hypothetical protein
MSFLADGSSPLELHRLNAQALELCAEISWLRRENERLIAAQSREGRHALRIEIEQLEASLVDAERDAARYRWLQDCGGFDLPADDAIDAALGVTVSASGGDKP